MTAQPSFAKCDSCGQEVHKDINGWWVGQDDTADCPVADEGHTVGGEPR